VLAEPIDALRSLQEDVFASIATFDLRNAAELIRQAVALNRSGTSKASKKSKS